jgi:predicted DNA-binding transcriptional regulator AlpA
MTEIDLTKVSGESRWLEGRPIQVANRATISLAEAAEILGIHRTTAWSLHKRGEFPVPVLRVGSSLRVVEARFNNSERQGSPSCQERVRVLRLPLLAEIAGLLNAALGTPFAAEFVFEVETSFPTTLAASWSLASTKWAYTDNVVEGFA